MAFNISTTAFEHGARMPVVHTCDGDDISPPLRWEGEPKETVTFALHQACRKKFKTDGDQIKAG